MSSGSKIDGLLGNIMTQTEFLGGVALQMFLHLADEIPEGKRNEIRRGVTLFLRHCIDEKLENVDAAAVRHYLHHLLNERVSKATFFHLFSSLQHFFKWTSSEVEGVFPDVTDGITPEYKITKVRRIKRGRGSNG